MSIEDQESPLFLPRILAFNEGAHDYSLEDGVNLLAKGTR